MRAQASYTITAVKDGNDLDSILMLWKKTTTNVAPAKPDGTNLNGWATEMPEFESGAYVWTCNRVVISDPTAATPIYIYTDPVLDTHWQKLDDLSTKYTEIKSTADEAYMKAVQNGEDITVLKVTTEGLNSTVTGQGQELTNIKQTVNNITLTVVNPDGSETSFKISDGKLDMTGLVTFTDLSTQGKTTINGSNITTGIINADLITAGTINGIEYISRSASQPNDYLQIWNSGLTTRKIGERNGYATYTDIFLSPGELSCQYGDIEQAQYIADYGYDGIRFRVGDDASSETPMSIIASRSDNVSRLTVTSPNVYFTGSIFSGSSYFKSGYAHIYGTTGGGDMWFRSTNSTNGHSIGFGVGNSGNARGIYDISRGHWTLYNDGTYTQMNAPGALYFIPYYGESFNPNSRYFCIGVTDEDLGPCFRPDTNGWGTIGANGLGVKYIYATNTGIQSTSDARLKENVSDDFSKLEKLFGMLHPVMYEYKHLADDDDIRIGFIAQDVWSALESCGYDPHRFAAIHAEKVDPETDIAKYLDTDETYYLNYTEFTALNTYMIQKLMKRIEELEKRIA